MSIRMSFPVLLGTAFALRIGMLLYGEWQDVNMEVKYTDIDYVVFTDAARFVVDDSSPYKRATYRYTPLLAWILTPNITFFRSFGKCIFIIADLFVGFLLQRILVLRGMDDTVSCWYSALWLLNPIVANISTRGNAESLLGVMVLLTLFFILQGQIEAAAIVYGFSVHFKVYPIIYSIALLVLLDKDYDRFQGWGFFPEYEIEEKEQRDHTLMKTLRRIASTIIDFANPSRIKFGLISASVFFLLTGYVYNIYGFEFIDATYLYHITRKDHRHNFSIWFYHMYLTFDAPEGKLLGLLAFIPQLSTVAVIGAAFGKDIFFCTFLQTFVFVMFNKVVTSQYFMWYICLFPLVLPSSRISFRWKGLLMIIAWVASQAIWLSNAYALEFLGKNRFLALWYSSTIFFLANAWIVVEFIHNHVFESVFGRGKVRNVWGPGRKRL